MATAPLQPAPPGPPAPPPPDPLQLIDDLLNPALDLPTIARAHRLTLTQLLSALRSPPVQAELEALRHLARERAAVVADAAAPTALATLLNACSNPGPTATDRATAARSATTLVKLAAGPRPPTTPNSATTALVHPPTAPPALHTSTSPTQAATTTPVASIVRPTPVTHDLRMRMVGTLCRRAGSAAMRARDRAGPARARNSGIASDDAIPLAGVCGLETRRRIRRCGGGAQRSARRPRPAPSIPAPGRAWS